jgi:hypothetical protein
VVGLGRHLPCLYLLWEACPLLEVVHSYLYTSS